MASLWMRSSRMRFLRGLDKRSSIDDLSVCQGVRVSVLAQDTFNAVAELVQLLLQDFVLGTVGFSGNRTHQFIQIIQGEVKDGVPPRWRHSQAVSQLVIGEGVGDYQVAFALVQLQRNGFIWLDGDSLLLRNDSPDQGRRQSIGVHRRRRFYGFRGRCSGFGL